MKIYSLFFYIFFFFFLFFFLLFFLLWTQKMDIHTNEKVACLILASRNLTQQEFLKITDFVGFNHVFTPNEYIMFTPAERKKHPDVIYVAFNPSTPTLLHKAIAVENLMAIKTILSDGTVNKDVVNKKNDSGHSPLRFAIEDKSNPEIFLELIKNPLVDVSDPNIFVDLAISNDFDRMKMLVEQCPRFLPGPSLKMIESLKLKVRKEVITMLTDEIWYILSSDRVFYACKTKKENDDFIETCLTLKTANFDKINSIEDATPLMTAAENGNLDIVRFLVERAKVNVHLENSRGHTAMTYAQNQPECLEYLVSVGGHYEDYLED